MRDTDDLIRKHAERDSQIEREWRNVRAEIDRLVQATRDLVAAYEPLRKYAEEKPA